MITVYDMTSGTLRQELEAEKKSAQPAQATEMHLDIAYSYEPALQEVLLNETSTDKSEARHIAGLDVDSFINRMK